jgi:hypothetical protein
MCIIVAPSGKPLSVESHRVRFWALFFLIYMLMILPILINLPSNVIIFVGDSGILVSTKYYENLAQSSNLVLIAISQWFQHNQLILNPKKAKIIKFTPSKLSVFSKYPLKLTYIDQILIKLDAMKFLGLSLENRLSWKNHVDYLLIKLISLYFMMRKLIRVLNAEILMLTYFPYFQ